MVYLESEVSCQRSNDCKDFTTLGDVLSLKLVSSGGLETKKMQLSSF